MLCSDVLIVGAGPTGLVLALWLTKLGVKVRIVDKTTGPGTTSRALAVQARTLELALELLERAPGARTTMQSPLRWSEDAAWKLDYNNVAQMSSEELARRRAEFDKQKEIARGNRAA